MTSLLDRIATVDRFASGLRIEQPAEGIRMLVLDRPAQLNALDTATIRGLIDELEALADDDATRVVLITGANGAFSAGADLDTIDLRGESRKDIEALMRLVMQIGPLVRALPQPTIAVMTGPTVGGALAIALGCDLRIAGHDASFLAPFIHMGLLPDCGATWLIPRLIGEGPALELMLTGRPLGARQAHEIGLVTHLADDPAAAAIDLATTIARRPPEAVRTTKQLVRDNTTSTLADAVGREAVAQAAAFASPEFGALYDAWRASRTPD
jgi:enoyl-CoA hydratase/carnithine racemase